MNTKIIISAVTYVLLIADVATVPFRSKKIMSKAGELKMALKNRSKAYFYAMYAFAFILPAIIFLRNYSLPYNLMFALVAIMGAELTSRDFVTKGKYGVYEHCAIVNGITVLFNDIVTFPILNLPEDEQEKYDHANLVVATKSKGNQNLVFANADECQAATKLIRELSGK